MDDNKKTYIPPIVDLFLVEIEQGFAATEVRPNAWDYEEF